MKSLFSVLTWTFIFLFLGFYINTEIENFSTKYENKISVIENHIIENNWDDAKEDLEDLTKSWHKEKNIWYKLLNHEYFNNVSRNLNILDKAISLNDKPLSFEQIELIKMALDNIVESERCDLNHIF
ncbi:DUF4363 family protein [Asaccharospora irregularis]|uniref:DUF4363 family protein n=1 Tax=Asaccharospora irregularis DSM 2635 TaxID=1121321 RepID=A0A1M5QBH3_9FIRM|nr:DUF4363 family protein [Asaccharospora irregularis]SHH11514.1 protein of unknown function [Asaccharospora irregularis DSM 2635]